MTPKDKQLLFSDLSARLPYHVKCKVWLKDGTTEEGPLDLQHNYGDVLRDAFFYHEIKDIKPYLRPMSSMTEEEKKEYQSLCVIHGDHDADDNVTYYYFDTIESFDWLNAHHFDYRGLIDRGLAIEVTEDNNPYKD